MPPSVPLAGVVVADYVVAPLLNEDRHPRGPVGTPYATFIAPCLPGFCTTEAEEIHIAWTIARS